MFQDFWTIETLLFIVTGAIIVIAIFVADRIVRRAIARYSKRLGLEQHVENIFKLTARIIIFAAGMIALLSFFGLPTEWFVGVSALTGAAIGFASTQTVGNFLAGLYIMISRPFMVMDYVKIGDIEGEVREITINYTKIYTSTYNIVEIPNRKVLDSTILNYSGERNIIDYSFKMGFPHLENVTNRELIEKCIVPAIEKFYDKYKDFLPKKPQVSMFKMDRLERGFLIRMFFPEGKIDTFYNIQPELMQNIVNSWDAYKTEKAS
ncbi:MAG: mechanosensitive ion channel family protein [Candidatus Bathyarchaeia archaeon]